MSRLERIYENLIDLAAFFYIIFFGAIALFWPNTAQKMDDWLTEKFSSEDE